MASWSAGTRPLLGMGVLTICMLGTEDGPPGSIISLFFLVQNSATSTNTAATTIKYFELSCIVEDGTENILRVVSSTQLLWRDVTMKFNESVFVTESIECAGPIRCQTLSTAGPAPEVHLPEACVDWTVRGNLAVEGRTALFVADASYLTARSLTIGNTRPVADCAVDLGDATAAFNTVHAAQIMQTSSASTKSDVASCPAGLDFVNTLRPVVFSRPHSDRQQYGFIAEELCQLDGCVATQQAVDYTGLLAPLTRAIQELSAKVDEVAGAVPKRRPAVKRSA